MNRFSLLIIMNPTISFVILLITFLISLYLGDELNALMAEILDFAQQDLGDLDDEEDEENRMQVG